MKPLVYEIKIWPCITTTPMTDLSILIIYSIAQCCETQTIPLKFELHCSRFNLETI